MKKSMCALLISLIIFTAVADEQARQIIRKVDQTERSTSSRMLFTMSIKPADGSAAREFSVTASENSAGDSLIEFTEPRTVRGMRILSRGNNSWVFFPSTGRIRKIGSSSRSGSVQGVGGDFSYDDLGSGAWDETYDFTLVRETDAAWELEGTKKSADAAYDSVRITVDKATHLPLVIIFSLVSEGGAFKELTFTDFQNFGGRRRAGKMVMKNLKKGSSTSIILREAQFDIELQGGLFDPDRFQR